MKITQRFISTLFVPVAILVFAFYSDTLAQEKEQTKGTSKKGRKKNEQAVKKEKAGKNKSDDNYGEQKKTGGSKKEKNKKVKYRPHGMTDEEMMDWTDGNPPGWSRGNKTGWGGAGMPPGQMKERENELLHSYPPGSKNWDADKKEAWRDNLEQSRARILERIRTRKGISQDEKESVIISLESAAREGVPIERVESTMDEAIEKGMAARDIEKLTRAMSYGADKGTDYNKLDHYIGRKMSEGEKGDDLALSIYREIDSRHAAEPEAPVKKSWWKRLFRE
jgi:hypothetical protein